ncbi:MAG: Fe-S cluster assembly ATPase SufC [Aeriscardovia sp.]|nr:Fe-S cluster assembly ATPase SufC [Aeriscardovia sp.]
MAHRLEIKDFRSSVATKEGPKEILKGVNLEASSDEIHVLMGPNGSGKSTLAYSLMAHPDYATSGSVRLDGTELELLTPDERAKEGLFLGMQYPVEVPGVPLANFLRTSLKALKGEAPSIRSWPSILKGYMERLKMDPQFAFRNVNEGFSGGEKKRAEILQLEVLKPKFAILDEIDSGLDVDALRIVSEGICRSHEEGCGIILITHYARILKYVHPDFVHLFYKGKIAMSGGKDLADRIEEEGYDGLIGTLS